MKNVKQLNGFTLIEYLIALGIVSFGLVSLVLFQQYALEQARAGYYRAQALIIAKNIFQLSKNNKNKNMNNIKINYFKKRVKQVLPQGQLRVIANNIKHHHAIEINWRERQNKISRFRLEY